ncbi:MAG TPA: cytochrome c [Burkholderiaceae bacterium]|nr:cytochrome c [Burkholderiaceae bacterium]
MSAWRYRVAAAVVCGTLTLPAFAAGIRLPEGPGANLVYAKCQTCHDLQYVVEGKGLLPSQWASVLASMKDYGLQISEAESQQVLQYLTTYLGPKPPPASTASAASAGAPSAAPIDGATVYAQNCASCHGAEGRGQSSYFPPLAGNPDLAAGGGFAVRVLLNGLTGRIEVNGQTYDGSMPSFGHLSDAEIAAVANHVRTSWGNKVPEGGAAVTPEAVAQQRQKPLTPAEVHAFRERMKR